MKKIEKHPSILEIKKTQVPSVVAFPFSFEIKNLNMLNAAQSNDTPVKAIKENYDIFAAFITENLTRSKTLFSQIHSNKQILSQYTKKISGMKRKIAGL